MVTYCFQWKQSRRFILAFFILGNVSFVIQQHSSPAIQGILFDSSKERFLWIHDPTAWLMIPRNEINETSSSSETTITTLLHQTNNVRNSSGTFRPSLGVSSQSQQHQSKVVPSPPSSSYSSATSSSSLSGSSSPICQLRLPSLYPDDDNNSNNNNNNTTITSNNQKYTKKRMIRRIYFAHMRKAGGTTIHSYLRKVAQQYGLEFVVVEAKPFHETIHADHLRSDTFYVTHVRDPIRRLISNYEYEGRWPCPLLLQANSNFIPTQKNARSMTYWMSHFNATTQHQRQQTPSLWYCTENCYTRWLALPYHLSLPNMTYEELKRLALQAAHRYHMILVLEWLQDSQYVQQLETFFGVKGLQGRHSEMYCYRAAKDANAKAPARYDNATIQLLSELNSVDYSLLQELQTCSHHHGIQIPNHTTFQDLVVTTADRSQTNPQLRNQ